jgi:hypothetical protein
MDVGAELRDARERAGLSREQVSQRTKIQLAKIEALEAGNFERLPEGIYLDGLIRAYASEVRLDGDALVTRLRHEAVVPAGLPAPPLAPELPPVAKPMPVAKPLPVANPVPVAASKPLPKPQQSPVPPPVTAMPPPLVTPRPVAARQPVTDPADYIIAPAAAAASPVDFTYAAPPGESAFLPESAFPSPPPHQHSRGFARYVVPVLALLAAIGVGAYLYEVNRPFPASAEIEVPALSEENSQDAAMARADARRDTPERAAGENVASEPAKEPPAAIPAPPPAEAPVVAPREGSSRAAVDNPPRASRETNTGVTREIPPLDVPPRDTDRTAPAAATAELSGFWTLDTRVESSSYGGYEGLQLGYRLQLEEDGNRVSGSGIKIQENGRSLDDRAQTPIVVRGTRDGNRITLTFTEQGARRSSEGKMILDVSDDGVLRGRFSSSAARSTGTAEARRPEG